MNRGLECTCGDNSESPWDRNIRIAEEKKRRSVILFYALERASRIIYGDAFYEEPYRGKIGMVKKGRGRK